MKFEQDHVKILLLGALMGGLTACSHGPVVQSYPETTNPYEKVQHLEKDIRAANEKQVNVLSPRNFKSAQESLADAQKGLIRQKNNKDILRQIAEGWVYLDRANAFAKVSHTNMEDVVVARQQAIDAGAPSVLNNDFQDADDHLVYITRAIEKNDLEGVAKNRKKLQASYLDLELKSIKQNSLGQALETITQARKEDAQDYAPRSLALAEKSAKDAEAYIIANRHETKKVAALANEARTHANHLLKITRDAKSSIVHTPEELALSLEDEQNHIQMKQSKLPQVEAPVMENENL